MKMNEKYESWKTSVLGKVTELFAIQYWPLGKNMDYLCKLVGTTQASCVFFSSFSILLIAVDRYLFIVHPTATQISTKQVAEISSQFVFNLALCCRLSCSPSSLCLSPPFSPLLCFSSPRLT